MNENISDIRKDYTVDKLTEDILLDNPFEQFQQWFNEVLNTDLPEPNSMALATASASGKPSLRMVLLKSFDADGFVFFTNYRSRKGRELSVNPQAALLFWWEFLERQIRIEGAVTKISHAASEAYFQSRPRGSQIGAWASLQSQPLDNRRTLEARAQELEQEFTGKPVPCPAHWGGFCLVPDYFEFWQGRSNRMHDRFVYRKSAAGLWLRERLFP